MGKSQKKKCEWPIIGILVKKKEKIMCIIKYRCRYIILPTKLGKNSLQEFNENQWALRI